MHLTDEDIILLSRYSVTPEYNMDVLNIFIESFNKVIHRYIAYDVVYCYSYNTIPCLFSIEKRKYLIFDFHMLTFINDFLQLQINNNDIFDEFYYKFFGRIKETDNKNISDIESFYCSTKTNKSECDNLLNAFVCSIYIVYHEIMHELEDINFDLYIETYKYVLTILNNHNYVITDSPSLLLECYCDCNAFILFFSENGSTGIIKDLDLEKDELFVLFMKSISAIAFHKSISSGDFSTQSLNDIIQRLYVLAKTYELMFSVPTAQMVLDHIDFLIYVFEKHIRNLNKLNNEIEDFIENNDLGNIYDYMKRKRVDHKKNQWIYISR